MALLTRNPVWVLAFFSVEWQWERRTQTYVSQSSMSPGFLFSSNYLRIKMAIKYCRNPVWVLAFFSVLQKSRRCLAECASRNPVWVLAFFSVGLGLCKKTETDKSQSSMSPGFLFSQMVYGFGRWIKDCRNPVWVLAFFSVSRGNQRRMAEF